MILRFGFKNFSSFKDGAEVSFLFDGNTPDDISNGQKIGTVLGIKGANGSGKTNILKALSFISLLGSFGFNDDKSKDTLNKKKKFLPVDAFFGSSEPTEFYIEFIENGIEYYYEVDIKDFEIHREALWKKIKTRRKVFERNNNEIVHCVSSLDELRNIELRPTTSILTLPTLYKFKNNMRELVDSYWFFLRMIVNVAYDGYCDLNAGLSETSKAYKSDVLLLAFMKELVKFSDSSIVDVEIISSVDNEGDEIYYPLFIHQQGEVRHKVTYSRESSGTRKIYDIIGAYFLVLKDGGLLALDEFDIHLHAAVLPKILELFTNPKINRRGAQFIFTSHNTEIIDNLGKYRTILVNKEESESYCYRLDEIPGTMIRNDRSIAPLYMENKIGGMPVFANSRLEEIMAGLENDEAIQSK